jgi:hypothetical protein
MRRKQILTIILGATIALAAFTTKVQANLQSRPGLPSLVSTTANDFFIKSRNMEQSGEALGLNASINQDNGTETSGSNNIDVHMAKSTEWGTVAILASSIYGTVPSGSSTVPIPNNKTGVDQMAGGKYEYTTGIYDTATGNASKIKAADAKYKNIYNSSNSTTGILGDATIETERWKGGSNGGLPNSSYYTFVRGYGGLFGFYLNYYSYRGDGNTAVSSRVAVVCGARTLMLHCALCFETRRFT